MTEFNSSAATRMQGHVLIRDVDTGHVLVDKRNSIHFEHMSLALARGLANRADGNIHEMHFGNGGSEVSGTGAITYFPSNSSGPNADLYNRTFFKVINDRSPQNDNPARNFIEVKHLNNTVYTDIIITCTLEYGEPSGQEAFDDSTDLTGKFQFDELGLKTYSEDGPGTGLLLTHICMSPILKSLNRMIEIIYTLRISLV